MRLGAVLACAFLVAACGTTVISSDKAEKNLRRTLTKIGVKVDSVSCPGDMKPKKGEIFACKITAQDGSKGNVRIREDDDKGNVTYISDFLNQQSVEEGVKEIVAKRVGNTNFDVTCPQLIAEIKGEKVTCTADDGEHQAKLVVTQTDGNGHYSVGPI